MVMLAVNSETMCKTAGRAAGRTCDDMEAVDLQLAAATKMEAFIDAKSGGAGAGWYRIVHSPEECESVMAANKLAVVLGVEVDNLFGCSTGSSMSTGRLDDVLDRYEAMGLRHVFPIHFSNNGFGGAAFQNDLSFDLAAPAVSNFGSLGQFPMTTEPSTEYSYRGGRRNVAGLTALGKHLVASLIRRGMIIDVDHMSARAKQDVFALCGKSMHPVVSGHTGFVDISVGPKRHEGQLLATELGQIAALGGMVAVIPRQGNLSEIRTWKANGHVTVPHVSGNTSNTVVQAIAYARSLAPGLAIGLGSDLNGFAGLPGPRFGPEAAPGGKVDPPPTNPLTYPFIAKASRKKLDKSVVGDRVFDFNLDGLAHVGMLPDMIADFEAMGMPTDELQPLLTSADGYLRVWFRAVGRMSRSHAAPRKPGQSRASFAVWRPSEGNWYVMDAATGTTRTQQWGTGGDIPVPGDYSGDGRCDFAVWRPSEGNWYVMDAATGTTRTQQWGTRGDIPVPGDYSGDGRCDFAVWRPSEGNWYVMDAATGTTRTQQWGTRGDIPVPGDYSGDGRCDFAVWRPSEGNWYVMDAATGTTRTQQWGTRGDIPVPGDYSGDGRCDFAVWRPSEGNWYVMDAATGTTRTQQWGTRGDIPVPGDYSGDGRCDFAVWRPSEGNWYVMDAATGTTRTQQWGVEGDQLV